MSGISNKARKYLVNNVEALVAALPSLSGMNEGDVVDLIKKSINLGSKRNLFYTEVNNRLKALFMESMLIAGESQMAIKKPMVIAMLAAIPNVGSGLAAGGAMVYEQAVLKPRANAIAKVITDADQPFERLATVIAMAMLMKYDAEIAVKPRKAVKLQAKIAVVQIASAMANGDESQLMQPFAAIKKMDDYQPNVMKRRLMEAELAIERAAKATKGGIKAGFHKIQRSFKSFGNAIVGAMKGLVPRVPCSQKKRTARGVLPEQFVSVPAEFLKSTAAVAQIDLEGAGACMVPGAEFDASCGG